MESVKRGYIPSNITEFGVGAEESRRRTLFLTALDLSYSWEDIPINTLLRYAKIIGIVE